MWEEVAIPGLRSLERMLGFSLPVGDRVAIIAYEGIYVVRLSVPFDVEFDDRYPEGGTDYNRQQQTLEYQSARFGVLGVYGGEPIQMSEAGERLILNAEDELLVITDSAGKTSLEFRFQDLSGDWEYATFSRDYRFILLGMPYALYVFQRTQ